MESTYEAPSVPARKTATSITSMLINAGINVTISHENGYVVLTTDRYRYTVRPSGAYHQSKVLPLSELVEPK